MKNTFNRIALLALAVCGTCGGGPNLFGQSVTFKTNDYATGPTPSSVAAADVFGGGRPAIITGNFNNSTLTVLGNFGNGVLVSNATYHLSSSPRAIAAADVNGDGTMDLISVDMSDTTVLTNYNFGSFGSNQMINLGGTGVATIDLNGHGRPDLLIGGNTSVFVFTNNGSGHFGSNTTLNVPGAVYSMAVSDVNFDGKLDLIVANNNFGSLTIFTNSGSGTLVSNATYAAIGGGALAVVAADINGDGYPDLISGGNSTLSIFTNNGSGIFGSNAAVTVARSVGGVAVADFNGDGLIDLVAFDSGDIPGIVSVATNSPTGFGNYSAIIAGHEPQGMAMADLNGDNKPDLVLGNTGDTITILLNSTLFISPPLNIVSSGSQSVLYWRYPAPNSVLQATTNLASPNWFTVTNGLPVQGVALPSTSPALYFRLISQ